MRVSLFVYCVSLLFLSPVYAEIDVDDVSESIVRVRAYKNNKIAAEGSGFVINAERYVLTNAHLLSDANRFAVLALKTGAELSSQQIFASREMNLALLQVQGLSLPPLNLSEQGADVGRIVQTLKLAPQNSIQIARGTIGAYQDVPGKNRFPNTSARRQFKTGRYVDSLRAVNVNGSVISELAGRLSLTRKVDPPPVGSRFRDCVECPEMVVVPSGSFTMGSPNRETRRSDDEGPSHRVHIGYPLAAGVYEVTFSEWRACVNAGRCGGYVPDDEGWGRGNRPVLNVSWDDAQSYVRWLSGRTEHNYGLLSESEWEYVARAGTTTPFHFGSTISTDQANYNGNFNPIYSNYTGERGLYRGKTLPVGSFRANAWGIHDMHGNVLEWVVDCWNYSYVGAPTDGSARESGNCGNRVLRGGSWYSSPWYLRSAFRYRKPSGDRNADNGFRVARRF